MAAIGPGPIVGHVQILRSQEGLETDFWKASWAPQKM
jgi:hypothetical protein